MRPAVPRGQDGFTMVELLVALSIFLLILMGIFQVFEPSNMAYLSSQRRLSVQQNGRVAMDLIVRQIRMAGYYPENFDQGGTANDINLVTYPVSVQVASQSALAVTGDLDGTCADPTTTTCPVNSSNAFLFCLDSSGLRRVKGAIGNAGSYTCAGGDILAESVTSLGFAYYDANNAPVPNPPTAPYQLDGQVVGAAPLFTNIAQRSTVRRIVITLTARETVPNQPAQTYTLTSDVRLRNP